MNGRVTIIKEGVSLSVPKGSLNKVKESKARDPNLKQATGKENKASSSSSNEDKPKEIGAKVNLEEEAVLAYMRAMQQTLGTEFLSKVQGLKDGRIALARIDDNDLKRAIDIKNKYEACSNVMPMEIGEGPSFKKNQILMNIMCWNCRGTAAKGFAGLIRDLKQAYSAAMIILLETHTSGPTASRIIKRIGFDNKFIQDAHGQSGGIWLLWDSGIWNLSIVNSTAQWIHAEVKILGADSLFITFVYGSPHFVPRQTLWDELKEIHDDVNGPWIVLGDFNATIHYFERIGPPLLHAQSHDNGFQEMISYCNLLDLGFKGDLFTWERGQTKKRLDHALCNIDWRLRFERVDIIHLPKFKSDHCPLLVNFDARRNLNRRRRPFRFEAVWLTHPSFNQLIQSNWRGEAGNVPLLLKELQGILREWNHNTFGNIFASKRLLMKKLQKIDRDLRRG